MEFKELIEKIEKDREATKRFRLLLNNEGFTEVFYGQSLENKEKYREDDEEISIIAHNCNFYCFIGDYDSHEATQWYINYYHRVITKKKEITVWERP